MILQATATLTRMAVPPKENISLNQSLQVKTFMPEPQSNPYWLLKRTRNVSKCHGCKSNLDSNYVLDRIECDFFPLIQKKKKKEKVWFPETGPKYYHPNLLCLKKRRLKVKVPREI